MLTQAHATFMQLYTTVLRRESNVVAGLRALASVVRIHLVTEGLAGPCLYAFLHMTRLG